MRRFCVSLGLVGFLVFGALAGSSAAQDGGGGGGFWEKMSGPGDWPYIHGFLSFCLDGLSVRGLEEDGLAVDGVAVQEARPDTPASSRLGCTRRRARLWLNLAGSLAWTGAEERPDLQSASLRALAFEPSVDVRVANLFKDYAPAFAGVGVGITRFTGEGVGFTRTSLDLRGTVLFWHTESESVHLGFRYVTKVFLDGFEASDFGTGTYTTNGTDWVHTFSLFAVFQY